MKFPYRKYPSKPVEPYPTRKNILRPVIPIRLVHEDESCGYHALVDSGADYCIFHAEIGELIGLNIKTGKKLHVSGIGGEKAGAYFHTIIMEVGGWKYKCYAGFSYKIETMPYGILGQSGFFNLFIVNFE
jgi:hypothetical protein